MGGIAALYEAAAYLIALVGYLLVVGTMDVVDPVERVALLVDNQAFLYALNLIAYIVWGFFQIALALALYERLKAGSPALVLTATGIGLVWAFVIIASGMIANFGMATVVDLYGKDPEQAATVWSAIGSVADGLSGASGETRHMGSAIKLGGFADRRASQGTELPWRRDRCGGSPLNCSASIPGAGVRFCAGQDRVVDLAGHRHVAQ